MEQIIAFVNQKGGVGKTTSCLNIGASLSMKGKRVLLIDADPQGNLTISAGIRLEENDPTVYDVLKGNSAISETIQHKPGAEYDILPADIMLSGADLELGSVPGREMILKECIASLENHYDFVLIDCPPSLNVITLMALTAATGVVIPVQAHFLALNGVAQLLETINLVQKRMNHALKIDGVIVTLYDQRKILNKEVFENLNAAFPEKVFKTTIGNSISLAEAPSAGMDIFQYKPGSKAAAQYDALTRELIERM